MKIELKLNSKRKLLLPLLILILLFSFSTLSSASSIGVTIDNSKVAFSSEMGYPFIDSNSRTQVPFRATMEKFGCSVAWDQSSQMAVAVKNGTTVKVPIGQKYIFKNGVKIVNDTAALVKDNRTYLPIRAVLEAFGASVGWNAENQSVIVNTIPSPVMKISFIDVGQGDSIFIDYGDYEILIDAGTSDYGDKVANYIKPFVQGDLDVLVATHVHADHIGGLPKVIDTFQIDNIIDSGETYTTATYLNYYAAAISEPNCNFTSDSKMTFNMGKNATFKIIELGDNYADSNDNSVVSMVKYNNIEVLLMGDLSSTVENANLSKFSDVDILKAGHHGSRTSTSSVFLDTTKPETIIISAGLNNTYGHPHPESLGRMFAAGSSVYGTFKSGTIVATTDGYTYTLNTSAKLTSADAGASTVKPATTVIPSANVTAPSTSGGAYVGSSQSNKYHYPSCRYVKTIIPGNLVYFKSKADAASKGYIPCKVCNP
ncbi:MAG: stalk domain-containing protein [Eubacteriales bacterium]